MGYRCSTVLTHKLTSRFPEINVRFRARVASASGNSIVARRSLGWLRSMSFNAAASPSSLSCRSTEVTMRVRLYRVILPVESIERAADFYAELLGLSGERISPGRHYFDCGGTILACYDPVADGDDRGDGWRHHFNQYVYFAVEDWRRSSNGRSGLTARSWTRRLRTCHGESVSSTPKTRSTIRSASLTSAHCSPETERPRAKVR